MCEFCSDTLFVFSKKESIQLAKKLNIGDVVGDAINQLQKDGAIDKATKKALWATHNAPLQKAVAEGFTPSRAAIEYGTPNYEFLKQLQTNTAVFAMFKNHAQIKEMAALLKDADGNLRSKEDFKTAALKVDGNYRGSKLDVEYDTAVRQARMASQWAKFQKNKHLYPNLRYLLTKAAKPDANHLRFVGIVRPVDDAFWIAHYPPNRWRCQCSVEQTDDEASDIPGNLPAIPVDFAFNSGITGQVFDIENSDYIQKADPKEIPGLIRDAKKFFNADLAATIPNQPIYKSKTGTLINANPIAFDNQDFDGNMKIARDLANGKLPVGKIEIVPLINDQALRKKLIPEAKGNFTPDFRIDGTIIEAKEPENKTAGSSTIQNRISKANKQANGIVLRLQKDFISEDQLFEDIYAKMHHKEYGHFKIYLKYGDQWKYYDRQSFLEEYNTRKKPR